MRIAICIYGDSFDPDLVSRQIDLPDCRTWKKGDAGSLTGLPLKETGWELAIDEPAVRDTSEMVEKLLSLLSGKLETIANIVLNMKLHCKVTVIGSGDLRDSAVYLKNCQISRLNSLHADFDLDWSF